MATITKATILTRVNQITRRSETDIDAVLVEALIQLSHDTQSLKATKTATLSSGSSAITAPSDFIDADILAVDGDPVDRITLDEWKRDKGVEGFCVWNDTIYLRPAPDSDKTLTLYYIREHAADPDTIEFDSGKYKEALVHLTASKLYRNYELKDQADDEERLYRREVAERTPAVMAGVEVRKNRR